jgi:hypothetical protein
MRATDLIILALQDFSDLGVYPMEVKEETSRTPSNDSSSEEKRDTKGPSELSEV